MTTLAAIDGGALAAPFTGDPMGRGMFRSGTISTWRVGSNPGVMMGGAWVQQASLVVKSETVSRTSAVQRYLDTPSGMRSAFDLEKVSGVTGPVRSNAWVSGGPNPA